jgi:hypothetical protein
MEYSVLQDDWAQNCVVLPVALLPVTEVLRALAWQDIVLESAVQNQLQLFRYHCRKDKTNIR